MTMPGDGRPDTSVNPDSGFELAQGFSVLVTKLDSLERVISKQAQMFERTVEAQARYTMAGQPQFREGILHQVGAAGGLMGGWNPAAMQQMTPMGAMSSLQGGQAYLAQRVGQFIAGQSLYGAPPGAQTSSAQQGGTSTPAGTPVSSPVPGSAAPPAPLPARPQPLAGLPGYLWGGQNAQAPPSRSMAMLQQVGARVALSGGTMGGLTSGLRHLPIVGTLLDTVDAAGDFYLKQREAGRVFQENEGGTNLGAQTERLHELAYQAGMFGRMPEGAAAQAFGQVTALGFNRAATGEASQGQNRQSALDLIYHNYTGRGMDVDQSVQILKTASQDATVNLGNVSNALQQLSDTAGKAGANADQARNQFNSYFNTALGQGASYGSTTLAGAVSANQASLGKQFAGVNFGGQLGQAQQYLMAGRFGITPSQAQQMQRTAPAQYANMISSNDMQVIQSLMTPQEITALQQMISQAGGRSALDNPDTLNSIANQFLNRFQVPDNINLDVWAQVLSAQVGIQLDAGHVMPWIVAQVGGKTVGAQAQRLSRLNKTSDGGISPTGTAVGAPSAPSSFGARFGPVGGGEVARTMLGTSASRAAASAHGATNNGASSSGHGSTGGAHTTAAGSHSGKPAVIALTAEARQLLKLLPGSYDQAAATSTVPPTPWPGQASR